MIPYRFIIFCFFVFLLVKFWYSRLWIFGSPSLSKGNFYPVFIPYIVSPPALSASGRFAWDAKVAKLNIISFAVEGTAKENSLSFIKVILYWNTGGYFFILQGCMFLLSALSAESKKETNSLRPLRLCGDYKLSNYNTIPYLRIRVLK